MCKYLPYLICKLTMTTHYEEEDTRLDKILLIVRRLFLVLFIWLIIWIILFKIIWINKDKWLTINGNNLVNNAWNNKNTNQKMIKNDKKQVNKNKLIDLWKNYARDKNHVYYKWKSINFVNLDKFYVITKDGRYTAQWTVINSQNLLNIFGERKVRSAMMKQIDQIIKKEKNVTNELKWASENWLYKMKKEYDTLSQFKRKDRYNMTDEQRAKFAIMYLYIKIAKSSHWTVSMETALKQLKYFLENFDKNDLKDELDDSDMKKIRWNIWLDDHCIYVNWKLYACFLNKLFIK